MHTNNKKIKTVWFPETQVPEDKKPVVLIDMDGVSVDLHRSWFDYLRSTYNLSFTNSEITAGDVVDYLGTHYGLTRDQIVEPFYIDNFWFHLEPQDNVKLVFSYLCDFIKPVIVTKPWWDSLNCPWEKHAWVQANLGKDVPFIATAEKYLIRGEYIIDDMTENLVKCYNAGTKTICYNQPWNKSLTTHITKRVNDWTEIYEYLRAEVIGKLTRTYKNTSMYDDVNVTC